jgi:uncharacterized cupredoxin-like copper-binding protein
MGAALAIALVGVSGMRAEVAGAASPKTITVHVTLREFTISMSRRTLPARTPIRFVIANRGSVEHETVLERAGAVDKALEVRGREYEADDIAPGTTRIVTWSLPSAGHYQLACHMPGHYQMGMKMTFTVTGN